MKKNIIIWICLLCGINLHSQNNLQKDSLSDINTIKRDSSFIYAESTMKDAVEAQSGARAILELKLQDWLRSKHPNEDAALLIQNSQERWYNILTQRGQYNRVFIYVAKKDVIPMSETEVIEQGIVSVSDEPVSDPKNISMSELNNVEEKMAAIINFTDIEPYIKHLKENKKLRAYGKYASLPEDDPCYIFVYDRDGVVVAAIRQTEDGHHFNLRSKSDDNVRNYKNCGAIWLQLK